MNRVKNLLGHSLFKGSFVVMVGYLVANVMNYFFHVMTGRMLSVDDYGTMQSLIALNYFIGVLMGGFGYVVINFLGKGRRGEYFSKIVFLEKKMIWISTGLFFVVLFLYPVFLYFLKIDDFLAYFVFCLPILFSFVPTIYQSALKVDYKFLMFSVLGVVMALTKIVFSYIFLEQNFKVAGSLGGIFVSSLIVTALGWFLVRKYFRTKEIKKIKFDKGLVKFSFLSLGVSFFLIGIYSFDIILVKHYFSRYEAGIYGALSTVGKIILFGCTAVLTVAYPIFVKKRDEVEKLKKVFLLSLLFIFVIGVSGVIVFWFFPEFVVGNLFGERYNQVASYVGLFGVFSFLLAVLHSMILFLLAMEKKAAGFLSGLVLAGSVILVVFYHDSIKAVVYNLTVSCGLGLILGTWFVIKEFKERKR